MMGNVREPATSPRATPPFATPVFAAPLSFVPWMTTAVATLHDKAVLAPPFLG